jgi:hypothetical protein
MTFKTPRFTGILSWMVIASLAVLSTDAAWSEAPPNSQAKKSLAKKPKVATKKTKRPSAESAKSIPVASTANPVAQPLAAAASVQASNMAATQTAPVAKSTLQPEAAKPTPVSQPQVSSNPYITVPQPNPWQVQVYKGAPANVNPYLAYRYVAPAANFWTAPPVQQPMFAQPTWVNPFLAFQNPVVPPANAWTPPAFQPPLQPPQFTLPAWVNPYLAYRQPVTPVAPWTAPTIQMPQFAAPSPWTPQAFQAPIQAAPMQTAQPTWVGNPYLANQQRVPVVVPAVKSEPEKPAVVVQTPAPAPQVAQVAQAAPAPSVEQVAATPATPWSTPSPTAMAKPAENAAPTKSLGQVWDSLKSSLLPSMPPEGQAILPTIKTVYPTGEKPLKVLTFKCPTELIGVTPLPTKALHELVNLAFDGINRADLLPFNMQQVCQ